MGHFPTYKGKVKGSRDGKTLALFCAQNKNL